MSLEREPNQRRSLRLQNYDYAQAGLYFVTLCAHQRQSLFGTVCKGIMQETPAGRMVENAWGALPARFPFVELDDYVIMPNHLHGLLRIEPEGRTGQEGRDKQEKPVWLGRAGRIGEGRIGEEGRTQGSPLRFPAAPYVHPVGTKGGSLGRVMQAFKSLTTHSYIAGVKQDGWTAFEGKIWQRDYHDHVIQNGTALDAIRRYIAVNPLQWDNDDENPDSVNGS